MTTLLRVFGRNEPSSTFDSVADFDEPERLSLASEGFCPFTVHAQRGDHPPVKLEIRGKFLYCPIDKVFMRFEWQDDKTYEMREVAQ